MKQLTSTIYFDSIASRPKHGVALIYDLEGFSTFFNQPDVQDYVPKFLNEVSHAISTIIFADGNDYWLSESDKRGKKSLGKNLIHEKFLGDGAMYLWAGDNNEAFTPFFVTALCNRLWNLKTNFNEVVRKSHDQVPVTDVPRRIRFGLARGTMYELRRKNSQQREYMAFV